jgi:hypothetical protein
VVAALAQWGLHNRPTTPTLRVRAELLVDGGPALREDFMAELRAEHLGDTRSPEPVPRIYELRIARQLCALADDRDRLDELIAEARALAGPACAPALGWVAD